MGDTAQQQATRTDKPEAAPSVEERLTTAATGGGVDAAGESALLEYFLGTGPAANADAEESFDVEVGGGRTMRFKLRSLEWAAHEQAIESARDQDGDVDPFVHSSHLVGHALVSPKLGPMLRQMRDAATTDEERAKVPRDGAAMLRAYFARQPGALITLRTHVQRLSKLDTASAGGVKEVEAGKL